METERAERDTIERELQEIRSHGKDDEQGSDDLSHVKLRASLGLGEKRPSDEDFDKDLRQYADELHTLRLENREIKMSVQKKDEILKSLKLDNERMNQVCNKQQQELIEIKQKKLQEKIWKN